MIFKIIDNNSYHLLSPYYVPSVLSTVFALPQST